MLKKVLYIILSISILLCLASCTKESEKNPLIGKWRYAQSYDSDGAVVSSDETLILEIKEDGTATLTSIDEYGADVETAKWQTVDNMLILTTGSFTERTNTYTYSISRNQLTIVSNDGYKMILNRE